MLLARPLCQGSNVRIEPLQDVLLPPMQGTQGPPVPGQGGRRLLLGGMACRGELLRTCRLRRFAGLLVLLLRDHPMSALQGAKEPPVRGSGWRCLLLGRMARRRELLHGQRVHGHPALFLPILHLHTCLLSRMPAAEEPRVRRQVVRRLLQRKMASWR